MMTYPEPIIHEIDSVLEECALRSPHNYDDYSDLPESTRSKAVNLMLAAISRLAPARSTYRLNAEKYEHNALNNIGLAIDPLIGVMHALRADYAANRLRNVTELIHAELFSDFLEMASYLLEQGYKDPAAVIIGSVLEEHLRKLCLKAGIELQQASGGSKKADTLNSELVSNGTYTKLDQKNVTAWLDLRNKAAHGNYAEYTKEQVQLMFLSVRDFIARHSA